jgi:hypothetical protein
VFERAAIELATEIDLDGVEACPLCLWELAWAIRQGRKPSRGLVDRTADWIWPEIDDAVHAALVRARMQERPYAEEALRELEESRWRSGFVQALVCRLAQRLADEFPASLHD